MSQNITHYQTSFVIRNEKQSGDNKLYQAQYLIGEWIKRHENSRFRRSGRDSNVSFLIDGNFKRKAKYSSSCSWCKTNYCKTDNSFAWAVEYTHRDSSTRDIFWVSEIGLRSFNDTQDLVVSVRISYKVSTEYALTGEFFVPAISIPWCVSALLESFRGASFVSGGQDITDGICSPILIATAEQGRNVLDYIRSKNRKLAVVLLLGETKEVLKEAKFLNKHLFAKAIVYTLSYRHELKRMFSYLGLEFNECAFIPPFVVWNDKLAHSLRYNVVRKELAEERHKSILRGWLGYHPVNEDGAVMDIANVDYLVRMQKFLKITEILKDSVSADEYAKVKADLEDMSGLFELSEEEKRDLAEKNEALKGRVGELENRTIDLEIKNENLQDEHAAQIFNITAKQKAMDLRSVSSEQILPRDYPDSFEALSKFGPFFKHLAFAEDAWKPAFAYKQFQDFHIAWSMLHDLDQKLWDIVFTRGGDIEREFNNLTTYQYASGEGKQTTSNSRLAQLRKFIFEDKEYEMWAHLKYGNRPGKQLRIYFAIDHEKRRIVVGYIGEHMDNATTRTIH